jgi:hypothetical protein
MEFIILSILFVAFSVTVYFLYRRTVKSHELQAAELRTLLRETIDKSSQMSEMIMAGSYQEWLRIKEGKKPTPNSVKDEPNSIELDEGVKIPFDEITGVSVDGGPRQKVKLYKS